MVKDQANTECCCKKSEKLVVVDGAGLKLVPEASMDDDRVEGEARAP